MSACLNILCRTPSESHIRARRPRPKLAKITSFNATVERFLRVDSARRFMSGQPVSQHERRRWRLAKNQNWIRPESSDSTRSPFRYIHPLRERLRRTDRQTREFSNFARKNMPQNPLGNISRKTAHKGCRQNLPDF